MKPGGVAICCLMFMLLASSIYAAGSSRYDVKLLEKSLNDMVSLAEMTQRPDPATEEGAAKILSAARYLAYYSKQEELEAFNKPLRSMGIEGFVFIPEKMVYDMICRQFGYDVAKHKELDDAGYGAGAGMKIGHFFYLNTQSDPATVDFKIKKVEQLKDGLLRVSGANMANIDNPADAEPFTALFTKTSCGDKAHWVVLKIEQ